MSGKKGVLVLAAVAGLLAAGATGCSSTDKAKAEQSSCKASGSCKAGGASCKSQSSCGKNSCG
jgi:hypothetical protein